LLLPYTGFYHKFINTKQPILGATTKYSTKKRKRGGLSIRANNDMLSHEICDKKNITSPLVLYMIGGCDIFL